MLSQFADQEKGSKVVQKMEKNAKTVIILSCIMIGVDLIAGIYTMNQIKYSQINFQINNLFRDDGNGAAEFLHLFFGIVLVFWSNFLVITGIYVNVCFLLIPWLIMYAIGKIFGFYVLCHFVYFFNYRICLSD